MDSISLSDQDVAERTRVADDGRPAMRAPARPRRRWRAIAVFAVLAIIIAAVGGEQVWRARELPPAPPPPPPQVTVSRPLQQTVQATSRFLGQFSAVDRVELRAPSPPLR